MQRPHLDDVFPTEIEGPFTENTSISRAAEGKNGPTLDTTLPAYSTVGYSTIQHGTVQ